MELAKLLALGLWLGLTLGFFEIIILNMIMDYDYNKYFNKSYRKPPKGF